MPVHSTINLCFFESIFCRDVMEKINRSNNWTFLLRLQSNKRTQHGCGPIEPYGFIIWNFSMQLFRYPQSFSHLYQLNFSKQLFWFSQSFQHLHINETVQYRPYDGRTRNLCYKDISHLQNQNWNYVKFVEHFLLKQWGTTVILFQIDKSEIKLKYVNMYPDFHIDRYLEILVNWNKSNALNNLVMMNL
jgi:hypothetical protein